jgi:STE24 endopeptidase
MENLDREILAKKYERIKLLASISETIVSFLFLAGFVLFGASKSLQDYVCTISSDSYIRFLLFVFIIGLAFTLLGFPFNYFFSYKLEHKFGLSNLNFTRWFIENLKGLLVSIVLGIPVLIAFYYLMLNYENWWLILAAVVLFYSVVIAQLAPVVIFPIFYKFKQLDNKSLKKSIEELCVKIGFKTRGVYVFDMSKNTKKANAALAGLGKTKRIILGDTLITGFSEDEIKSVVAHELGHYRKHHILKNILFSVVTTFLSLYIISVLYESIYPYLGYVNRWDLGVLPILIIVGGVLGLLLKPLSNIISQRYEFQADKFAVETTGDVVSFKSMMEKLAFHNLADKEPSKIAEFFFHSHPSVKRRIERAESYKK